MDAEVREFIALAARSAPLLKPDHLVVYSAVFGGHDVLSPIDVPVAGCEFVCFADDESLSSPGWKIALLPPGLRGPRRSARALKLLPHLLFPNSERSVWVDASCVLKRSPLDLWDRYAPGEFSAFVHPNRFSILAEACACIAFGRGDARKIVVQVLSYMRAGYPHAYCLLATGVLLRRHHEAAVVQLMESWAHEIEIHSDRDQLSLGFCLWRNGSSWTSIELDIFHNEFVGFRAHNRHSDCGVRQRTLSTLLAIRTKLQSKD